MYRSVQRIDFVTPLVVIRLRKQYHHYQHHHHYYHRYYHYHHHHHHHYYYCHRIGMEYIPTRSSTDSLPLLSKRVDNKLYRKKMKPNKLETVKRRLHKNDNDLSNSTELQNLRMLLSKSKQRMETLDGLIINDMSHITQIGMYICV
jgi:hypothetical protein